MIENAEQLEQSRLAALRLETSLGALRDRVQGSNPALFEAMAQDYVESIRRIRTDIDNYLGLPEVAFGSAPLWLTLSGDKIGENISSRLLSEWLGRFRRAVYHVASYIETGSVRTIGRPKQELIQATDLYVLALQPGSIRVGLRPPSTYIQEDLFTSEASAQAGLAARALDRILRMALWASSGELSPPLRDFPDRDEAAILAHQVSRLAPSPRSEVDTVKFDGALLPTDHPIFLGFEARHRLHGLTELLSTVVEETVYGTIREIDLDAKRIILRERGPGMSDLKCLLNLDLLKRAERLLDRPVVVRGLISSGTPDTIEVISLEPNA